MKCVRKRSQIWKATAGLSLLEVTFAMASLAIVMGGAAQTLVTYHEHMELQRQRTNAMESCRTVVSQIRTIRDANINNFPDAILAVFPNDAAVAGFGALTNQQVVVSYTDVNDNPLEVNITCTWADLRGRPVNFNMTTLVTDR